MLERGLRLLRRTFFEWGVIGLGAWAVTTLIRDDEPLWAAGVGAGFVLACGLGVLLQGRSGDWALAWRCPHLDRLGLKVSGRDAPWDVLRAAEGAIATLEQEAASFRAFFDGAHRDILESAHRAVALHHFRRRTEHALMDAPVGEARAKLEIQCANAGRELEQVHLLLRELKTRFIASSVSMPAGPDPAALLHALEERTGALGEALDELRRAPRPQRTGGRA
jgi:hypothetical protein